MSLNRFTLLLLILVFASVTALAQDTKTYSKDGLSFNYPNGWTLHDDTNSEAAPKPTQQPSPQPSSTP